MEQLPLWQLNHPGLEVGLITVLQGKGRSHQKKEKA